MNRQVRKYGVIGVVAVCCIFLFSGISVAGEKTGYVNMEVLFDSYEKTKDADAAITQLANAKQIERDALVENIRRMKDEMVVLAEEGEARRKKQEDIDRQIKDLQAFDEETRKDLRGVRDERVKEIFDDLDAAIKTYGQKKGYDLIFNNRALAYSSDDFDVTDAILKDLNSNYKK
ncbi:MAG: OmpH family outer membrane protein [Candidatus Omnitrophica bacterium]|nr:OmpH family outer membrane protein [Candidatus Omnitrophota bacterium]